MPVRGLTLVLMDAARLRPALELACANAALGGRTRLFAQGPAVAALAPPLTDRHDADYAAAGQPALATLFEEALGLGVEIIACQSGMQLVGLDAAMLDPRIGFGGPVSTLQTLGDDRLVIA